MIKYMTGSIFEDGYIEALDALNQKYAGDGAIVSEIYGSTRSGDTGIPTARPDFRLKPLGLDDLEKWVESCHKHKLLFNYTMNAPFTSGLGEFEKQLPRFVDSLKKLENMGVDRVTVANPLILEIICKHTQLPVELSTILHINSLHLVPFYATNYPNVNKICLNLYRNRDIGFVKAMNAECVKYGIELEIMATEFCSAAGAPCFGAFRMSCYDLHGKNQSKDEAGKFANYPMGRCIYNRAIDKATWLKSRVVYPNEVREYHDITGVNGFKITTRTAPKHYGLFVIEQYLKMSYDDNMMGLWMQLQTIRSKSDKFDSTQKKMTNIMDIDCGKLSQPLVDGKKFYDKWFQDPRFRCDEVSCDDCGWCGKWEQVLTSSST